ncbi:MAG: hypothetical protein COA63_000695 [Methylophaga sp.]|nr:hypothetical protein [Methylophaga sp.]
MKTTEAVKVFQDLDVKYQKYIYNAKDLAILFSNESSKTLQKSLLRYVRGGVLERVVKGVYVYAYAQSKSNHVLEGIALALRSGEASYVSLESMLSEYSLISQIPVSRVTIMTTGRAGTFKTPYGVIELTHTNASAYDISVKTISVPNREMRIATVETAKDDLKKVNRNTHLLDESDNNNNKRFTL